MFRFLFSYHASPQSIASGNPAVMEKVKVDTEIRKLGAQQARLNVWQWRLRWRRGVFEAVKFL